jgi:hypothetical protein
MLWQNVVKLRVQKFRPAAEPTERNVQWVLGGNEADLVLYIYVEPNLKLKQERTKSGHLVAMTTKHFRVASNISGSSVSNLLHVTLLAPITFRWLLDF